MQIRLDMLGNDLESYEKRLMERYKLEIFNLKYEDLIFSPISQIMCQNCGMYGRRFRCPPYVKPYYHYREKLKKFTTFKLILSRENISKRLEEQRKFGNREFLTHFYAGNQGAMLIKKRLNDAITDYETFLTVKKIKNFALESGGGCRRCKKCTVEEGKKGCKKPKESKPSPEAIGIDLYTILQVSDIPMEFPPMENYIGVGMICMQNKLKENEYHNVKETIPRVEPNIDSVKIYDAINIFNFHHHDCENCPNKSNFLCDIKWYRVEDLTQFIINKKLYVVKLHESLETLKGIDELHKIVLRLRREGYWWTIPFYTKRCTACEDCSLETHMNGGYKLVANRRIMRCLRYFNLFPEKFDEYHGYILV